MSDHSQTPPAAKSRLNLLLRVAVSTFWAFPLSAVIKAIVDFDQNNFIFRDAYSKNLPEFVAGSFHLGLQTLIHGGFPPVGDHPLNMYPYIIPAWLLLFFLLSRGWRSFERRR